MSGGFILESSEAPKSPNRHDESRESPKPMTSLSSAQERRLRDHIDDRFQQLERDERKHAFGSMDKLLVRLRSLLNLILQIPPPPPPGSFRIAYLLTFTGSIIPYIVSLPLGPSEQIIEEDDGARNNRDVIASLIDFLTLVDDGWQAVLRGDAWVVSGGTGRAVRVPFAAQVDTTERTRLRSIIISGRQHMVAWARMYGDFGGSSLSNNVDQGTASEDPGEDKCVPNRGIDGGNESWESSIVGMWNGTLDMLTEQDFGSISLSAP